MSNTANTATATATAAKAARRYTNYVNGRDQEGRDGATDYCFPTASGAPVDRVHVAEAWRTARAKLGRDDVRIHDLRHHFAVTVIERIGVHRASAWLGHTDSAFTGRIYGQRTEDSSVAQADARRLYAVA